MVYNSYFHPHNGFLHFIGDCQRNKSKIGRNYRGEGQKPEGLGLY